MKNSQNEDNLIEVQILSHSQVLELAERQAQNLLGVTYEEALLMLDRGELDGTLAETELKMIQHLLKYSK